MLALLMERLAIGAELLHLRHLIGAQLWISRQGLIDGGHVLGAAVGERRAGHGDGKDGGQSDVPEYGVPPVLRPARAWPA